MDGRVERHSPCADELVGSVVHEHPHIAVLAAAQRRCNGRCIGAQFLAEKLDMLVLRVAGCRGEFWVRHEPRHGGGVHGAVLLL